MLKLLHIRNSNAFAGLFILCMTAIMIFGYIIMLPIYAGFYNKYVGTEDTSSFVTQELCVSNGYYWFNSQCNPLNETATDTVNFNRYIWLTVPWIVIVSLFIWGITVAVKDDPVTYGGGL